MNDSTPHYLLLSESTVETSSGSRPWAGETLGRWRIVLETVDGSSKLEASDQEEMPTERLELLAVVRGLEAIPQPAKVTLVTASRYVSRGMRFGMAEWRESDWQWERFGKMIPVANADLWQRLDRALRIHEVQCRTWRFDETPCDAVSAVRAPHWLRAADRRRNNRIIPEESSATDIEESESTWQRSRQSQAASLCVS